MADHLREIHAAVRRYLSEGAALSLAREIDRIVNEVPVEEPDVVPLLVVPPPPFSKTQAAIDGAATLARAHGQADVLARLAGLQFELETSVQRG